jgi:hypothetical protein
MSISRAPASMAARASKAVAAAREAPEGKAHDGAGRHGAGREPRGDAVDPQAVDAHGGEAVLQGLVAEAVDVDAARLGFEQRMVDRRGDPSRCCRGLVGHEVLSTQLWAGALGYTVVRQEERKGKAMEIAVIGSCMTDLIAYTDTIPKAGETFVAREFAMGCGGKGANQAVAASRLGAEVLMMGRVGDDSFADTTLANFAAYGVSTEFVTRVPGVSSGVAPIWVDADSQNRILIIPGANHAPAARGYRGGRGTPAGAAA